MYTDSITSSNWTGELRMVTLGRRRLSVVSAPTACSVIDWRLVDRSSARKHGLSEDVEGAPGDHRRHHQKRKEERDDLVHVHTRRSRSKSMNVTLARFGLVMLPVVPV